MSYVYILLLLLIIILNFQSSFNYFKFIAYSDSSPKISVLLIVLNNRKIYILELLHYHLVKATSSESYFSLLQYDPNSVIIKSSMVKYF